MIPLAMGSPKAVDLMTVFLARRGGTGSKYMTIVCYRASMTYKAAPFVLTFEIVSIPADADRAANPQLAEWLDQHRYFSPAGVQNPVERSAVFHSAKA